MKRSKPPKDSPLHRPFGDLKSLLKDRRLKKRPVPGADPPRVRSNAPDGDDESRLFQEAMAGVVPLQKGRRFWSIPDGRPAPSGDDPVSDETIGRLECLIRDGEGFVVSQTPEYMEGKGPAVCPHITERLHQGRYSIEAHIDLHGQTAAAAEESFDRFLRESTRLGRRAVLVIHGRGLSSPSRPVLKRLVNQWLSSGYWRKWVLAFCSARLCDGGAGATYVLLRNRPLTKKQRKEKA